MEQERIYEIIKDCKNQNSQDIVKRLKNEDGLIKSIIENLSCYYKKQFSHPIYSTLFQLYCSHERDSRCFVLQFVPPLTWIYLSAMTRRDKQGYGKLEAIFLTIYNTEAEKNGDQQKCKTFRLPSLSRSSIYHESSIDVTSQSALTESALSRHELNETAIPGPNKQLNRITAANRMSVLQAALNQYNKSIAFMDKASHNSYWLMVYRVAVSGFSSLCTPETGTPNMSDFISDEEQTKLTNHPRIPLSAEVIQEMMQGLYYLMYNGYRAQATKTAEKVHYRAAHSLLAPAHVLTNAVHHSLTTTGGLPHDGPLGLQVHLSNSNAVPDSPDSTEPLIALTTKGLTIAPHEPQFHSDHDKETNQTDAPAHPEKTPAKEKLARAHVKSSSTGHWKISLHPHKAEYELETLPQDSLKMRFSSDQNSDHKATAAGDCSDEKVYSTKL